MIHEHAFFSIVPGQESEFERAYTQARPLLFGAGALSAELSRCVESPSLYLLLVGWESVEAHMEGFRGSPAVGKWRAIIGPFFAGAPEVTHYDPVPVP
jgi:heme-degrading monooxygenase HmoA